MLTSTIKCLLSRLLQALACLSYQPLPMFRRYPIITRNAQLAQRHIKAIPTRDRAEIGVSVSGLLTISPQEVTDERLSRIGAADSPREVVFQFAREHPHIIHPVALMHSFKVDCGHTAFVVENEIRRGHISVDDNRIVSPDLISSLPGMAQLPKMVRSPVICDAAPHEHFNDLPEIS